MFIGRKSKIQLMVDYGEETPVYRLSLGDELKAEMYEEADNLEVTNQIIKVIVIDEVWLEVHYISTTLTIDIRTRYVTHTDTSGSIRQWKITNR